ncbi:MAG TPA: autotransporter domain-containing protein, partial [Parvibaculum sp.]
AGGSITVTAGQTAVTVDSDNSLLNTGAINALLAGGIGVDVTAQTTFGIVNGGTIKTGTAQVLDSTGAVTTAAILGGPAIQVSQDLGAGISNSISITTVGANAVLIQTDSGTPATITLGVVNSGVPAQNYGIYNNGSISSTGGGSGDGTATVLIAGDATHTTTITNGINNASSISGSAIDADATAISIGQGGIVDTIANTGSIGATTAANTIPSGPPAVGGTAVAINIDAQGSLPSITNAGTATIFATASAAGTNATAILDQSGTLLSVTNNGTIEAFAGTTASPGTAVALNLSSASGNETVANNGGVIIGNILLGSGNDTITQTLNNPAIGAISGTIDMGLGTNSFTMSSGSMSGAIRSSGGTDTITLSGSSIMNATSAVPVGTLDLIVNDATFRAASGGTFNATTAEFNDSSTLAVTYDPTGAVTSGELITSGATTFNASALATAPKVSVVFTSYLAAPASIDLVQASGFTYSGVLTGAGDLLIGGVGVGYNAALVDSGTVLTLDLTRKTAGDLGYTGALAAIYTAAADPLALDTTGFGAAVGNIGSTGTQAAALATLKSLYTQLLPDISGAREETAIRVQDIASGFISDRLNLLRTADQGVGDGGGEYDGYRHRDAGFWAQESVSNEDGKGGSDSQSYNGTMYVFSIGYDKRGADSDVWGASINYAALTYNTPFSQSDNVAQNVMGQLYYSMNQGPLFWDSMGGLGWNNYDLHRTVNLSPFSRSTSASWTGYQGGLASQVGYAAMLGPVSIRPSVGASYTILDQQAYTEKGGGTGVDLAVDSNTFQSLRANAEIRVSTILSADPQFVPYVRGGISHELLDAKPKADGNFVGGGPASAFSIEGDPLNKDTPYVGIGLSAVGGFSHLTIEYTGMFGDRVTSQQAAATVSMAF